MNMCFVRGGWGGTLTICPFVWVSAVFSTPALWGWLEGTVGAAWGVSDTLLGSEATSLAL